MNEDNWVFYLKLSKELPESFFALDQHFKRYGKSLVPISLKTLLEQSRKSNSLHVVLVLQSLKDLKYYNKKVKKAVKMLMISRRLHLYIASSFSSVLDSSFLRRGFYTFDKLPLLSVSFVKNTSYEIDRKETSMLRWPGGIRPRLSIAS